VSGGPKRLGGWLARRPMCGKYARDGSDDDGEAETAEHRRGRDKGLPILVAAQGHT